MKELLLGGQKEQVSRDDLIKDLAGERMGGERRCQQQGEKEEEEEAELQGHSTDPAHSHTDHTPVLLAAAAATKLDFFFSPGPSKHDWNSGCGRKGEGHVGTGSTESRKCHAEHSGCI